MNSVPALFLLACMTVGAVTDAAAQEFSQPYSLNKAELTAVRRDLKRELKDPDSARYGDIAAAQDADGIVTVCGEINAKNSYGGYTGSSPFIGVLMGNKNRAAFVTTAIGGDAIKDRVINQQCVKAGIN